MSKKCKITPRLIEIMQANAKLGFTYSALAVSLGISEDTLYSWIRKGRDEGTQPYCTFYAALKEAESELLRECLDQLKLSMRQGNIESTKWLMEKKFNKEGYGKQSSINVNAKTENKNLNLNVTVDDKEKLRNEILARLVPKNRMIEEA
jgi:transposase